jgi:hypothetical protein
MQSAREKERRIGLRQAGASRILDVTLASDEASGAVITGRDHECEPRPHRDAPARDNHARNAQPSGTTIA